MTGGDSNATPFQEEVKKKDVKLGAPPISDVAFRSDVSVPSIAQKHHKQHHQQQQEAQQTSPPLCACNGSGRTNIGKSRGDSGVSSSSREQ